MVVHFNATYYNAHWRVKRKWQMAGIGIERKCVPHTGQSSARLSFRSSNSCLGLRYLCGLAAVIVATVATTSVSAENKDKSAIRMDAFRLMGASLKVPGVAAYCEKNVGSNPRLMAAARAWNDRHHALLTKTVRAVEWSGGMSTAERAYLDRFAYKLLEAEFDSAPDKSALCNDILTAIEAGDMELAKSPVTAEAARHIMTVPLE